MAAEEVQVIHISVRNLVEFVLRSGDLDNRRSRSADREAMQKGGRIHRKIQKQMGMDYHAEVVLVYEEEFDEFVIRLEGRADGIIKNQEGVTIDEIKGVYLDIQYLEEPIEVHRAQAMCYAYMYAREKELDEISVQMTYCHLESEIIKRFEEKFTFHDLQQWFSDLMTQYYQWAAFQFERKKQRSRSMEELEFPFPYREGQRDLVAGVYQTILRQKQLFIQAPTGVGKTMSTIFPAVRAVGRRYGDKIFYLTAKTITRTVAKEAFTLLQGNGLSYKVILITAKEKMCLLEEMDCNPRHCPYAKGHFDRVNEAVFELLHLENIYDREVLEQHAKKWSVCPYEMCLDIATWVDAIICDYNYVFDPNVHLRRFFGDNVKGEYLVLIDEAHNLVERGRQMYSAVLYKEDFLEVKKAVKGYKKLSNYLEKCNRQMLEWKRECEAYTILPNTGAFTIELMNLLGEMEYFLEEEHQKEVQKAVLELSFAVRHFLNMSDLVDENYVIYTEHTQDGRFFVKLFCVNPACNLQSSLDKGRSAVFFSATLLPISYYRSLFSTRSDDYAMYASSPFDRKNLCLLVGRNVSSRYKRRNYVEYKKIAEYIHRISSLKAGNYMVFFPSYRLLLDVYEVYEQIFAQEQVHCLLQSQSMSEEEREIFLSAFAEEREDTLLGFCVMGGIFSEGIDLIGDRLIGTLIVGTGIPQVNNELEILKNYYDEREKNGFDYAYRFPGMNKVLQAAGRVIRTKEDRGIVVLLDDRFLNPEYSQLFPREWDGWLYGTAEQMVEEIRGFWGDEK